MSERTSESFGNGSNLPGQNFSVKELRISNTAEINKTIICVDYVGDTEILCELSYDESDSRNLNAGGSGISVTQAGCDGFSSSEGLITRSGSDFESSKNQLRELKIGSLIINIRGATSSYSDSLTFTETENDGNVTHQASGDLMRDSTTNFLGTRVLYLDARHNIAAYEIKGKAKHARVSTRSNVSSTNLPEGTETTTLRDALILDLDGAETEIAGAISETTSQVFDGSFLPIGVNFQGGGCDESETSTNSSEIAFLDEDTDFTQLRHPQLNVLGSHSFAVDSSGNMLISITRWKPVEDSFSFGDGWQIPYEDTGTFNFFTGGDLSVIIPAGTPDSNFSPAGVIN